MLARSVLVLYPTVEESRIALDSPGGRPPLIPSIPNGGLSNLRYSVLPCFDSAFEIEVYWACGAQGKAIKPFALQLIKDIQPTLVILPGIAGGSANRDLGIGDVVVSDEFMYAEREKHGRAITGVYRTAEGHLGHLLETTAIAADIRPQLRTAMCRATMPSYDELMAAAANATDLPEDVPGIVAKATQHFQRLSAEGPRVAHAVLYSDDTNWQKPDNPLVRLLPFDVRLQACEMEACFVTEAMRELGRRDNPLLIKAISDIPGFLRSEPIKDLAREIAAAALRSILQHRDFVNIVQKLPLDQSFNRAVPNMQSRAARRLEVELTEPTPDAEALQGITNLLRREPEQAAACADLLTHRIEICPRCANGGETAFDYRDVMLASFNALSGQRGEAVRAAQLLNALSVLDPTLNIRSEQLAAELLGQLRRRLPSVSLQRAAYGVLYQMMATDTRRAYDYWRDLRSTSAFSDESLGTWLFTMFSARVSAGSSIEVIKRRFKRDWERYRDAAERRNPHSIEIMDLIPLLDELLAQGLQPTAETELRIVRLAKVAETHQTAINVPEKAIINTIAAAYYKADHFLEAAVADADSMRRRRVKHIPLVPLAKLFDAVSDLTRATPSLL